VKFNERFAFQLRAEFLNAFNYTNFSSVDIGLNDPSFGQVTGTHLPRNVQLGGKITF